MILKTAARETSFHNQSTLLTTVNMNKAVRIYKISG